MNTPRTPEPRPIDPLLQQRLQQLGARPATGERPASRPTGRRAKPARAAKLSALALSAVSTVMLAGLFAQQADNVDSIELTTGTLADAVPAATTAATTATADATATTAVTATTTAEATAATTATTTAATTAAATQVADGAYVGVVDTNRWGNMQVQVVYSGSQITDVQIVQYPDGDNKSVRINSRALPTLISESISSQSADVSTVSGATYTSVSYRVSLQSAIDNAKAASGVTG